MATNEELEARVKVIEEEFPNILKGLQEVSAQSDILNEHIYNLNNALAKLLLGQNALMIN